MAPYKPQHYNSLSPYLMVENAAQLVQQLEAIFEAKTLRRFDREDGKMAHVEVQIDDTVVMISEQTAEYPAAKVMLHLYVPDVFKTFETATRNGCEIIQEPFQQPNDPDIRGAFYDCAGNYWAVSTPADAARS